MADRTYVYEFLPGILEELGRYRLGIVSTNFSHRIRDKLGREKLERYFDLIIGGENVSKNKPDPERLLLALQKLHAKRENAIYVGDSRIDAETAYRAKIRFVAVLTGVTALVGFNHYQVLE